MTVFLLELPSKLLMKLQWRKQMDVIGTFSVKLPLALISNILNHYYLLLFLFVYTFLLVGRLRGWRPKVRLRFTPGSEHSTPALGPTTCIVGYRKYFLLRQSGNRETVHRRSLYLYVIQWIDVHLLRIVVACCLIKQVYSSVFRRVRKIAKRYNWLIMSVRPSAWYSSAPTGRILMKFGIWAFFFVYELRKLKFHWNLTWRLFTFMVISRWIVLKNEKCFRQQF